MTWQAIGPAVTQALEGMQLPHLGGPHPLHPPSRPATAVVGGTAFAAGNVGREVMAGVEYELALRAHKFIGKLPCKHLVYLPQGSHTSYTWLLLLCLGCGQGQL